MDRRRQKQLDDLTPPKEFKLFYECLQGDDKHYDCPKESTTHICACPMHPFDNEEGSGEEGNEVETTEDAFGADDTDPDVDAQEYD